jgi:phosphoribosylamine--glycine ligase
MKYLIFTEFGELLDLAIHLQDVEKQDVTIHIPTHDYQKIGDGIVKKEKDWFNCLGQGYTWVFDGCSHGRLQEWLRERGEVVFGGSEMGDKLENDRQLSQAWFKKAGFYQPESKNFKSIDDALKFVQKNKDRRWILKQNGDAPKSLNHMGKFDGSIDLIYHLEGLKAKWNEAEFGKFDCDLMEVVEGLEVAASAFFNGSEYLRNKEGKVVGYLNFEEKKEADGATGETTGEMGTTFIGVTEDNNLFKEILLKEEIIKGLRNAHFRGVFDINCIKTDKGLVALEATCRFGIPGTSYEFIEGLKSPAHVLIDTVAKGESTPVEVHQGVGMVMCVVAKPYPVEADMEDSATSVGEKLWILEGGKPVKEFTEEQKKHIHLENFFKEDGDYLVATKNGYLLTVTGLGKNIADARETLIQYIKDNLYISGMKYRTDIGKRVEKEGGVSADQKLQKKFDEEVAALKKQHETQMSLVKEVIKKAIYE